MKTCRLAIGSDHRGAALKQQLIQGLKLFNDTAIEWIDLGCSAQKESCEYPLFSRLVCKTLHEKKADLGLLLCGTGVGMAIAANRFAGIYAALCWNTDITAQARSHDHANILVVPADYVELGLLCDMTQTFIVTEPLQDYHAQRVKLIDQWGGLVP